MTKHKAIATNHKKATVKNETASLYAALPQVRHAWKGRLKFQAWSTFALAFLERLHPRRQNFEATPDPAHFFL